MMAHFRIGTAPVSWGVDADPNWGPQLPPERVLAEVRESGYEGTEIGPPGYLPEDVTELRRLLDRHRLALISAYCAVDLHGPETVPAEVAQVRTTARLLAAFGARQIIVGELGSPHRAAIAGRVRTEAGGDILDAAGWERLRGRMATVCEIVAPLDLAVAFHPHAGTYVETVDEVDRFLDAVEGLPVGLCLDSGHTAYAGDDPVAAFRRYAGRVNLCHLKDIDTRALRHCLDQQLDLTETTRAGVFVPLGQGNVDIAAIVVALRAIDYDGWLVVEQDRILTDTADPVADARASWSFLTELLSRSTAHQKMGGTEQQQ